MLEIWPSERVHDLLDRSGIHDGFLAAPSSDNDSAWGAQLVRCVVLSSGNPGPRMLISSGVHGDEVEGPVALSRILLAPAALTPLCGSLVILPVTNPDAFKTFTRHSGVDGANLNRLFWKNENSAPSRSDAVRNLMCGLLTAFDAVVDLHSGGRSLEFEPCAMWHEHEALAGVAGSRDLAMNMSLPYAVAIRSSEPDGTFDNLAARQGKIAVAVELGGGSRLNIERYGAVLPLVKRAMSRLGMAEPDYVESSTTAVEWPTLIRCTDDGVIECLLTCGAHVLAGQIIARLHVHVGRKDYRADDIRCPHDGVVLAIRTIAAARIGDAIAAISILTSSVRG